MKRVLILLCGVCAFQGNLEFDNSSQVQAQEITQSGKVTVKTKQVVAQQKSTASQIKTRKAEAEKKRRAEAKKKRLKEKAKRKQNAATEKKRKTEAAKKRKAEAKKKHLKEKAKRKQNAATEKKRKAEENRKRKKAGTKVLADTNKTIKSPHEFEDGLGKVCDNRARCEQGSMPCCPDLEGIIKPTRRQSGVDIYLAAGPRSSKSLGQESRKPGQLPTLNSYENACNKDDVTSCGIYQIKFDLKTMTPVNWKLIVNNRHKGEVNPTVTPDGQYIAYERRGITSGSSNDWRSARIWGKEVAAVNTSSSGFNLSKTREGHKPFWRDNHTVIYTGGDHTIRAIETSRTDRTWIQDTLLLGGVNVQSGMDSNGFRFDDANVNPDQPDRVVVHQAQGIAHADGRPQVINTQMKNYKKARVLFDLDIGTMPGSADPQPHGLIGCAHANFSPSGDLVLCTSQGTYSKRGSEQNIPTDQRYEELYGSTIPKTWPLFYRFSSGELVRMDLIYGFERKVDLTRIQLVDNDPSGLYEFSVTSSNSQDGTLFRHLNPVELYELDNRYRDYNHSNTGPPCQTYFYKYASFCGTNDHLVATVFCVSEDTVDSPKQLINSNTVIIDITDRENPEFYLLNHYLRDQLGYSSRVHFEGYTGTCSK